METNDEFDRIATAIDRYVSDIRTDLDDRWSHWFTDLSRQQEYEVLGGLMAREVSLATQLALAPMCWNEHAAPLFLRAMIDAFLTFAWIFEEPDSRAQSFIKHGLGQEKLFIEHHKQRLRTKGLDPDSDPMIQQLEDWVNSIRFTFLTEVNVGNWNGSSTRKIATDLGYDDLYRYEYSRFSDAVHSMWNHVAKYNLDPCANPLHRNHSVPRDLELDSDIGYVFVAARYVDKTFGVFDRHTAYLTTKPRAIDTLTEVFTVLNDDL